MAHKSIYELGVFIYPSYSGDMKFDDIKLVRYGIYEIELCYFDDEGPAPVTFVIRADAEPGLEKFNKFVVREEDGGMHADVLRTTSMWRDSYFNIMPLDEFLKKTLG